MLLEYKPGATNRADGLLRQEDNDDGSNPDNDNITVWPDSYFCKEHTKICVMDWDSLEDNLDQKVKRAQYVQQETLKRWSNIHGLILHNRTHWHHGNVLVVVEDNDLRRGVTSLFHDQLMAGHPGISKTLQLISLYYWWPNMKTFVTAYIRGCATCQMTKVNMQPSHPPLSPITPEENAHPFETIAMDFITKLPLSGDHNMILTITDTDCSKVSIFLPCKETIDSEGVTQLYLTHILPHYRLPKKIISNRDPRFTSRFGRELCQLLNIRQNIFIMGYMLQVHQPSRTSDIPMLN